MSIHLHEANDCMYSELYGDWRASQLVMAMVHPIVAIMAPSVILAAEVSFQPETEA